MFSGMVVPNELLRGGVIGSGAIQQFIVCSGAINTQSFYLGNDVIIGQDGKRYKCNQETGWQMICIDKEQPAALWKNPY